MPYSFMNDYSEGAHEKILEALVRTNREQAGAYGTDIHSAKAAELIRERIGRPDADVHFITGGTQTNLLLITAALRPWQAAVAADTGHINVHEAGSIEAAGHKILTFPNKDGKLEADKVDELCALHYADASIEHLIRPGLVYISHPTETGTLYTKAELAALRRVCDKWNMYLYLDGARLGSALAAEGTNVGWKELGELCDAFYIGGTKMGALNGEALVICRDALKDGFRQVQTQRGAMPAKGKLLGIQFETLLTDGLYEELGIYANAEAKKLREGIRDLGYGFLTETKTNQIFPILPKKKVQGLSDRFILTYWGPFDEEHDIMRLCTSWATDDGQVDAFLKALAEA